MTDVVLASYTGGDIKGASNRAFVRGFLDNLPQAERAALVDGAGGINADGVRRIENSLVAAAYGDADIVARFAEATDDNSRAIVGAMADAAGDWARLRRGFDSGDLDPALDLTANLLDALRLVSRAREFAALEGRPVHQAISEAVAQMDLLSGALDVRTEAFVRAFYRGEGYRKAKSREDLAVFFRSIVSEVEAAGRPQLFGDQLVSGSDIMQTAGRRVARQGEASYDRQGNRTAGARIAQIGRTDGQQGFQSSGRGAQEAGSRGEGRPGAPALKADLSAPRPAQPVRGLAEADQLLHQPEQVHMLAAQYGVDPRTGDFLELAEVKQLEVEGRLDDVARTELDEADKLFTEGVAYGDALKAAVGCLI